MMIEAKDVGLDTTSDFRIPSAPTLRAQPRFRFGAGTDTGKVRQRNEDQFLVATLLKSMRIRASSLPHGDVDRLAREQAHLMVVADGLGGANAGQRASTLAVEEVEAFTLDSLKWFLHRSGSEENALVRDLREMIAASDRAVIDEAEADRRLRGMGTTLTMAYNDGNDLFIAHAGDSRAYLLRDGQLRQLTKDHTLVQAMVDGGLIRSEDARHHARRHVVTNVVGGPEEGVVADVIKLTLRDGDVLLLCSDGLSEPVGDARIADVLTQDRDDPEAACRHLIDRALASGGPDNVTAIVARFDFDGAARP